ncbi:hypothetical protein ACH5RR_033427 [Cinchona calisaya]|uniref:F-box protein n=1 Tax=Cinchona calisaya TaxID=153742 RepID=A0ABD2YPZ6_9GENT
MALSLQVSIISFSSYFESLYLSSSKYWREICESDCIWKSLCEERWPGIGFEENDDDNQEKPSTLKGWRGLYIKRHNEMAGKADNLRKGLCCQTINANDYLKAIKDLNSMKFGFRDVQILLLQPKIHVLLNLVGLRYRIKRLGIQVNSVIEAISCCKIQDRQVDIHWWTNGGWLHRFHRPDVLYSRCISLKDLTTDEGD